MPVPMLYLDLDGTARHGKDQLGRFVNSPEDVVIFPEAITMMRRWRAGGGRILGVSNQGGIALGHLNPAANIAAMERTNKLTGRLFDNILWCEHHPAADRPEMARCWCRKPAPGLLIAGTMQLAGRYPGEWYPPYMALMVGDRPEDQECARIANVDFQWAAGWRAQAAVNALKHDVLVWGAQEGERTASGRVVPAGWVWTCSCGELGVGHPSEDAASDAAEQHTRRTEPS
jgi:D-glycero-D-manno-heptose 1,7-bisphosphate phosphatase